MKKQRNRIGKNLNIKIYLFDLLIPTVFLFLNTNNILESFIQKIIRKL